MFATLGWAALLAVGCFGVMWAVCVRIRNYAFLDVAFSYGLAVLLPLYLAFAPKVGLRQVCFAAFGFAWSLRLGTYLLIRIARQHPHEDVRYQKLRDRWRGPWMFLVFFEMQALLVVFFSTPFLMASFDSTPGLRGVEAVGLSLAWIALLGESLADWQMARFKAGPNRPGEVCEVGLWRFSRHPNYFFEFVVWIGVALAAVALPWGWTALFCPLLMLFFLFRVTGIPLTEEFALRSKGEAYRRYQQTTSAFVPWFRKSA